MVEAYSVAIDYFCNVDGSGNQVWALEYFSSQYKNSSDLLSSNYIVDYLL